MKVTISAGASVLLAELPSVVVQWRIYKSENGVGPGVHFMCTFSKVFKM